MKNLNERLCFFFFITNNRKSFFSIFLSNINNKMRMTKKQSAIFTPLRRHWWISFLNFWPNLHSSLQDAAGSWSFVTPAYLWSHLWRYHRLDALITVCEVPDTRLRPLSAQTFCVTNNLNSGCIPFRWPCLLTLNVLAGPSQQSIVNCYIREVLVVMQRLVHFKAPVAFITKNKDLLNSLAQ